jgi:hypothetical protein
MKHLKKIAATVFAGAALSALLGLGSASATTLEVEGAVQNQSIVMETSLKAGTSMILKDTFGFTSNTCTNGGGTGNTESPFSGTTVTGRGTNVHFSSCEREPITGHKTGTLHIQWTSGTNGTVSSSGAEVTSPSPFGTLNCKTGAGTHLGSLTGVKSGHATMDVNAAISCSGISSKLEATLTVTTPTGLGAVS